MSEEQASWIYQARRVNTQTNAGGGALTTRISIPSGQLARIINIAVVGSASATSTLIGLITDEDGNTICRLVGIAAGVSLTGFIPTTGTTANATFNFTNTTGMILAPGQYISFTAGTCLQNETLAVYVELELFNKPDIPTWDTTGSAGTPSLAASTISAANTWTPGRLWT